MRVTRAQRFRCELCGKYRVTGVTENEAEVFVRDGAARSEGELDPTVVCVICIIDAQEALTKELGTPNLREFVEKTGEMTEG